MTAPRPTTPASQHLAPRRWHVRSAWALIGAAAIAPASFAQSPPAPTPPGAVETDPSQLLATLGDPTRPPDARRAAARTLLHSTDPRAREHLESLLDSRTQPQPAQPTGASTDPADAQATLLRAIADAPVAPPWLAAPLIRLVRDSGATDTSLARRSLAIGALSSVRSRDAIRGLVTIAGDPATPDSLTASAYKALARLTGHEEFGADHQAWTLWLSQIEWQPEAEFRRILAEGLAAQTDRLTRERDSAADRLTDDLRAAVQAAASIEVRSRLIEHAIRDPLPTIQRAGFAMALSELANTRALDERVPAAALELLSSPALETRRAAADLLSVLAPSSYAQPIAAALERESDPGVASRLLKSVARWPTESVRPAILRWAEGAEPARSPAIDAAEALFDRGMLIDPADRSRLLTALTSIPIERLSPAGVRLRYLTGADSDRGAIRAWLVSAEPTRRQLMGESLARDPVALRDLVDLARTDAVMFVPALKALTAHSRNVESYHTARLLRAPDEQLRKSMLLQLCAQLSTTDLLTVARAEDALEFREAMLARLTGEPVATLLSVDYPFITSSLTMHPSAIAGLQLLAETRLELNQPASALRALDTLAPINSRLSAAAADMRTKALVWLGRIDDAEPIPSGPEPWIDALAHCLDQPHAPRALAVIESRFAETLTPEQSARVATLREQMRTFVGPRLGD